MGFLKDLFSPDNPSEIHPFKIHAKKEMTEEYGELLLVKAYGCVNPLYSCRSFLQVSIVDITKGLKDAYAVYSRISDMTEDYSPAFQFRNKPQDTATGVGYYENYSNICAIPLSALVTPFGGHRKLHIIVRNIRENSSFKVHNGFAVDSEANGLLVHASTHIAYHFEGVGYSEATTNLYHTSLAILDLAVITAMADGSLDRMEGIVIKKWMTKILPYFPEYDPDKLKETFNSRFKETYGKVKDKPKDKILYQEVISVINALGTYQDKVDALQLCYEVLAANGEADEHELKLVKSIALDLDIDHKEVDKIKDITLISLDSSLQDKKNIDAILSIDPDWDKQEIESHLYKLYAKWSGRLNALNDEHRREAQSWIDTIAEAKKKHGL